VRVDTLYLIVHVAPKVSREIAQMMVESGCFKNSVCFFLEAWLDSLRNFAAGTVAGTAAGVKHSWLDTADTAAANHLDFAWLDANLWNLAALADRLGVLAKMNVNLRISCTLFTNLPVEHQQHVAQVPLRQILNSPHLPTRVIADHAAAGTLVFLKAALTRVAARHNDTAALAGISDLTIEHAYSIILGALTRGGLKRSITASLDVDFLGQPLAVLTRHRNRQLEKLRLPFTRVPQLSQPSFAMALPLLADSFAFATRKDCTGFADSARFDVCAKAQELLGVKPELDAAAMEERLRCMRAATAMTARDGGGVAAAAAVLVERGTHASGFGTLATKGFPSGVAAAKTAKRDHKKGATTQKNNRNSHRCTNEACKYRSACAEDHQHIKSCVKPFDPRGTVHGNSLGRGKALCYYCDVIDLGLERA
jgi:hypothetical protein